MDAYVKDGKIIKVEGCKSLDGMNQGVICVKGAALQQSTHHKDRLLYPMRRTGKRGEAKFQRISWEEAFSIIAENLKKGIEAYGAESTMTYIGHPLLGDSIYSSGKNKYGFVGQALHAKTLGFIHPSTGEYIEFSSNLPEEFEKLLAK